MVRQHPAFPGSRLAAAKPCDADAGTTVVLARQGPHAGAVKAPPTIPSAGAVLPSREPGYLILQQPEGHSPAMSNNFAKIWHSKKQSQGETHPRVTIRTPFMYVLDRYEINNVITSPRKYFITLTYFFMQNYKWIVNRHIISSSLR